MNKYYNLKGVAQWLEFHILTAGGPVSIPSQGTKILQGMGRDQKNPQNPKYTPR